MQVKVYNPKLSVKAWHGTTEYDLTPYILQAVTHRQMGEVQGQWSVLVQYREDKRWDKLLSSMDYVEIAMSRYSATPQIRMRGFISNVRRTKTIDPSGNLRRTITINGNDFGKLFAKYQIYYAADVPGQTTQSSDVDPAQMLLDPLLYENLGVGGDGSNAVYPLSHLIPDLVSAAIKPWIDALRQKTPNIPYLVVPEPNILPDFQLSYLTLQSMQGGLDSAINQFANQPWCEWFIYETNTGPQVMNRNAPFKDSSGNYIWTESALSGDWANVEISAEDIIEYDVGTSDNETYDYFFTYPALFPGGDIVYKFTVIGSGGPNGGPEFGNGTAAQKQAVESNLTTPTNPKILHDSIYKYGLQIMEIASPAISCMATSIVTEGGGSPSSSASRDSIVSTAEQYLGVHYVPGGTSPSGFDCSGFVQYVFAQNGIKLPRVASDQSKVGTPLSYMRNTDPQPGDLCFFQMSANGGIDHVGIWVSSTEFISATVHSGIAYGSLTDPSLDGPYWSQFYQFSTDVLNGSVSNQTTSTSGVDPALVQLSIKMNMWLVQAFGWAPQMINGTLRIKGNENITIGRYLTNTADNEEYYVESVDDVFTISQIGSTGNDNLFSYIQTVGVTRGRSL